jgi:hypothetical protein
MDWGFLIYLILLLIVSVEGIIRYKKLTPAFKILVIQILVTSITESIKKVIGKIFHNSMPVAHLSSLIEYSLFALTYYNLLQSARLKKLIIISIFIMLLLETVNIIFFESLLQFPSVILNISQFIYVLFSLLMFRQMLLDPAEQSLSKQSIFWFNLDMLFYGTTMFLNYALTNYFIQNNLDTTILFYFSVVVNLLFYILIGISILIDNKKLNAVNFDNDQ